MQPVYFTVEIIYNMLKNKILLLLICSALQPVFTVMADDEFNMSFIRGGAQDELPEVFDKNVNFVLANIWLTLRLMAKRSVVVLLPLPTAKSKLFARQTNG